jgi:tRNA dimethylallyltransferase
MDKKLLVICGPTATGKTELAIYLAQQFNGELVSADSRQVYRGMDIGTGKELPVNSKLKTKNLKLNYGYYVIKGIKVWGYDLVDPYESFSAGQYAKIARRIIENVWERERLPILVGGTGFYIKVAINGIASADITPDSKLRKSLEKKSTEELFEILAGLDPLKAASMNISDKKNSRRLIRAIEIALRLASTRGGQAGQGGAKKKVEKLNVNKILIIGLTAPREYLSNKIEARVEKRLAEGFEQEARRLIERGVSWKTQAMQSLGYKQFKKYHEGEATKAEFVNEWIKEEKKYARRQMTWFRKDKRIVWFNISNPSWKASVEKLLRNW